MIYCVVNIISFWVKAFEKTNIDTRNESELLLWSSVTEKKERKQTDAGLNDNFISIWSSAAVCQNKNLFNV